MRSIYIVTIAFFSAFIPLASAQAATMRYADEQGNRRFLAYENHSERHEHASHGRLSHDFSFSVTRHEEDRYFEFHRSFDRDDKRPNHRDERYHDGQDKFRYEESGFSHPVTAVFANMDRHEETKKYFHTVVDHDKDRSPQRVVASDPVSAVPLPASLPLFAAALALCAFAGYRRVKA